jgi:hypothetical protein
MAGFGRLYPDQVETMTDPCAIVITPGAGGHVMTVSPHVEPDLTGQELTSQEERALLEREVARNFNITLEEFERRWRAGEYRDDDDPRITSLGMLLR